MKKNFKQIFLGSIFGFVSAGIILVAFSSYAFKTADSSIPSYVLNGNSEKSNNVDFSLFWTVWNTLDQKFVNTHGDKASSTEEDRINGAIKGMVDSLNDPYTIFLTPKENKDFTNELSGSLEGVGMEVGIRDNFLTVISPLKNSPAEKAGIKAGDKIVAIDDIDSRGMSVSDAIKIIRGKKGTVVKITVLRGSSKNTISFSIFRDVISLPIVDTEKNEKEKVFVIKVYNFSGNVSALFRLALREFVESGYQKLVVDLRNNPGGYLEAAVDMASWFLERGKIVVIEDFAGKKPQIIHRSKGYDIFNDNLKMAILVNGGSASASEIFAGALSEYNKAVLVGSKTFGKGSVQELIDLPGGAAIKVTIAKWLTPKGSSISEAGLLPQFEVKVDEEKKDNLKDLELEKAFEVLRNY